MYNLQGLCCISSPPYTANPNIWAYVTSDNIATVSASGYFDPEPRLHVNDAIRATCSDGTVWLRVASLNPTTVVNDMNNISNLQDGYIWIGNNLNVATPTEFAAAVAAQLAAQSLLQYVAVPITASQFNGMYAAPKALVAAGGANTLLVLDKCILTETYNSAAYAAGGTVAVQYDSTANGAGVIASTTLANTAFQGTASTNLFMNAGVVPAPFATCVNKGLYLSNISGAFTTGNSDMVAHVWYKSIPTV
jgi:hypothetical protein